jgi:hypothetical protein
MGYHEAKLSLAERRAGLFNLSRKRRLAPGAADE